MPANRRLPLITIDAGTLSHRYRTGIGRYLESILPHLIRLAEGSAEVLCLAPKPLCNEVALRLVSEGKLRVRNWSIPSHYAWQQTVLGHFLWRTRPDVHFAPDGLLPILCPCPTVGVVHDMIWRRYPETASMHIRAVFSLRQKRSLRALTVALTDSEATRQDLIAAHGSLGQKIRVVPLGVNRNLFHPLSEADAESLHRFRTRLGLPPRYIISLGNLLPHKNLQVVVRALGLLKEQAPQALPDWLAIGHGDKNGLLRFMLNEFPGDKIHCPGYLSDADIALAMRGAAALVFPSLYEGFGLPVLEAMASGIPVLHSGSTSLPEVAGAAGVEFDPESPKDLAGKLLKVLQKPDYYRYKVTAGLARAQNFSWECCAEKVWTSIREVMK